MGSILIGCVLVLSYVGTFILGWVIGIDTAQKRKFNSNDYPR